MRRSLAITALALAASRCAGGPPPNAIPAAFPGAEPPAAVVAGAARAERAAAVVETAMALKGSPYRLGGRDPATGFDCSGLVWFVFSEHAITLPRTVAEQVHAGRRIDRRRIEAGDLVFFATTGRGTSHVGIAIDGEQFIHAPDTGAVVRIEQLDAAYWRRRFTGARRII